LQQKEARAHEFALNEIRQRAIRSLQKLAGPNAPMRALSSTGSCPIYQSRHVKNAPVTFARAT
jgi:hypothetical protein